MRRSFKNHAKIIFSFYLTPLHLFTTMVKLATLSVHIDQFRHTLLAKSYTGEYSHWGHWPLMGYFLLWLFVSRYIILTTNMSLNPPLPVRLPISFSFHLNKLILLVPQHLSDLPILITHLLVLLQFYRNMI